MKAIKLCHEDSGLFGTKVTQNQCDFLQSNLESFMQMYKTQGSTFWLRFLMSFRSYLERKFACNKHITLLNEVQFLRFIKVLNYIFIHIHKKLIEGSNTSVKKFVKNLIVLGLNSPEYLKLTPKLWLNHLKSSKALQNILQNLLGLPEPSEYNDFIVLLYIMYSEFIASVVTVFEQWYSSSDLTEDELKKIDTKIIYWLPNIDTDDKNCEPLCFEKYISDYWKENLQKMLLTEHVHDYFSKHNKKKCCDHFEKEKNIFNVFTFSPKAAISLMKIMYNEEDMSDERDAQKKERDVQQKEDEVQTITEVSLKELCVLKPQIECCEKHKDCFTQVSHDASCPEPFLCDGSPPCVITCENDLKNKAKKSGKFWKNITVQVFRINKKKRDVSTSAESSENQIETYVNVRGKTDFDISLSMLKYFTSQYVNEWNNLDFNRRKNECLDRLRRKLRERQNLKSEPYEREAFKESFCRMTLMEDADSKLMDMQLRYCFSRDDSETCDGICFKRDCVNTIGINSSDVFGRVVTLAKTSITITQCCKVHNPNNHKKHDGCMKSNCKNGLISGTMNTITSVTTEYTVTSNSSEKNDAFKSDDKVFRSVKDCKLVNELEQEKVKDSKLVKEVEQKKIKNSKVTKEVEQKKIKNSKVTNEVEQNTVKDSTIAKEVEHIRVKDNKVVNEVEHKRVKDNKIVNEVEQKKFKDSKVAKEAEQKKDNNKTAKGIYQAESNKLNVDDEIDEIFKVIGIGQNKTAVIQQEVNNELKLKNEESHSIKQPVSKQDKEVENFLNLICEKNPSLPETSAAKEPLSETSAAKCVGIEMGVESKKVKLRICAYCKKQEIVRKTFKRCSKCKEENFPDQRYYCSRECLIEDWAESHEEEHLRNQKLSS